MKIINRLSKMVWIVMLVLSLLFLSWTIPLLLFSGGQDVLEQGLKLAGSTMNVGVLDKAALGFMNMSMLKPVWEEVWIGILGVYCALNLRQMKKDAWTLSLFWGIMMLTNAAIQGTYEVVVLNWSGACLQTYLFLVLGSIAVLGLLITRKDYLNYQPRR